MVTKSKKHHSAERDAKKTSEILAKARQAALDAALAHETSLRLQLEKAEYERGAFKVEVCGLQQNVKGLTAELLESKPGVDMHKGVVEELQMGIEGNAVRCATNCTGKGKGWPYDHDFKLLSRQALASGASADECRDLLRIHAGYMLQGEKGKDLYVSHKRWYSKQREAV